MTELGISIPFGALLLALVGYVIILAGKVGRLEGVCENLSCIPDLKRNLDRMMWRQEQDDAHSADILHRDDHRERDLLILGLMSRTLT